MLLNQDMPRSPAAKKVRAVIFDWAGTTVDFGSLAPVRTMERVFGEAGVPILEEEARRDMGIAKLDHIAAILRIDRVRTEWQARHRRPPTAEDVDVLYQRFIPLQFECLQRYSNVIAGVPEVIQALRQRAIKISSTTGYTRAMLDLLITEAAKQGYSPDCSFSPEDAGSGRPGPFMIYAAAVKMQVYPLSAIVKVGDTESDIKEGLNAGAWSVGVLASGNGVGLSESSFNALEPADRARKLSEARQSLAAAGAHYIIETLSDLRPVLDDIDARLSGSRH